MAIWMAEARDRLLEWQSASGGFGYRPGSQPMSEPTALAALALLAQTKDAPTKEDPPSGPAREAAGRACSWLAKLQQADGGLGLYEELSEPRWPTAQAALAWHAHGEYPAAISRASNWLLDRKGRTLEQNSGELGHDGSLLGWPWVEGTSSWLEPTAWAVLALTRAASAVAPESFGPKRSAIESRVREARRLILDREVPSGGWNYGNSVVLGTALRAHLAPSGLCALALANAPRVSAAQLAPALAYIRAELPATRAPQSLCMGLLALRAWSAVPPEASSWLEEAFLAVARRPDPILQLAYLLLAAAPRSLALLTPAAIPESVRPESAAWPTGPARRPTDPARADLET